MGIPSDWFSIFILPDSGDIELKANGIFLSSSSLSKKSVAPFPK